MISGIEKKIEGKLAQLTTRKFACLVREAKRELTAEEMKSLSSDRQKDFSKITASSRKLEWSEARRCEQELRKKLGTNCRTSISHSRHDENPIVFSVGVDGVSGIGIDAELATRSISEAAAHRFVSSSESQLKLSPIEIWVIKEALFKANPENHDTTLPEYSIVSFDSRTGTGEAKFKERKLKFACLETDEWVVSVALFEA